MRAPYYSHPFPWVKSGEASSVYCLPSTALVHVYVHVHVHVDEDAPGP